MPTIDWPEALIPQTAQLVLRKIGSQFSSPLNGTLQAVDFIGERWVLSTSLAQMSARNPRGVDAFCNRMSGGVERVRVWAFHTKGVPRGNLRGSTSVLSTATRGMSSLNVAGAVASPNTLLRSGFDVNPGGGLAPGWTLLATGSTGTVTASRVIGNGSPFAQRVQASALGSSASDVVGVNYEIFAPVVAGNPYALSADVRNNGAALRVHIDWYATGASYISSTTQAFGPTGGEWGRRSVVGVAPAGAVGASLFVWMQAFPGGGAAWLEVDNVQFEATAVASPSWAGPPSLREGDYIGAGGQLFQVAADVQLADDGTGSVPIINRVRSTIAAGSPLVWYRPTCDMVLPAMQAGPVRRPGVIESTALDLVEVW